MRIDARIPVRFGSLGSRQAGEAVLTDGPPAPPPSARFTTEPTRHSQDCSCCTPRSAAATALATLFRERATSTDVPFRSVLASMSGENEAAVRAALASDPIVSMRYRLP